MLDGLNYYKEYSDSDWQFTLEVESSARRGVEFDRASR